VVIAMKMIGRKRGKRGYYSTVGYVGEEMILGA
jgi:hypothetical protein